MIYYQDDLVTLYHGDCLEITEWTRADVLVTDPPYGIAWSRPAWWSGKPGGSVHAGIKNDVNPEVRDFVLELWEDKPWAMFGSPLLVAPKSKQVLVWQKPSNAGIFGTIAGFRRDWEAIFLGGSLGSSKAERSSILKSNAGSINSYLNGRGHPHTKPIDLMEDLIQAMPDGLLADPFAGSGSTLLAARNLGKKIIGVELDESYCELIAKRLSQSAFDFSDL
jgi:site-specific DNA-methyltransferase (adenine-specific)